MNLAYIKLERIVSECRIDKSHIDEVNPITHIYIYLNIYLFTSLVNDI